MTKANSLYCAFISLGMYCCFGQVVPPTLLKTFPKTLAFEQTCDPAGTFVTRGPGFALEAGRAGRLVMRSGAESAAIEWINADGTALPQGQDELPGKINFIIGADPKAWCLARATFRAVTASGIYPGVNLTVRASSAGEPEFDITVDAGFSPNPIRMRVTSPEKARLDPDGSLRLSKSLHIRAPSAYQGPTLVASRFVMEPGGDVAIELGHYDRQIPLVIDPVLGFSSYIGGSAYDTVYGVSSDASGSVFVTGETYSQSFPLGLAKPTRKIFVSKLNSSGTAIIYTTILGGTGGDSGRAISADNFGNAWITGNTLSTDFPVTTDAYKNSASGQQDAFLVKLSLTGTILYSSYFGAEAGDFGTGIANDAAGSAYITGYTGSLHFPTTTGALQTSYAGGSYDAFAAKFDAGGRLVYSTLLGGSGNDSSWAIAVDWGNNVYLAGQTDSTNFPRLNSFQAAIGGASDAFIAKLDPFGAHLIFSTYLGGLQPDQATGIALDPSLNVYVTGVTASSDFPTTGNVFQPALKGLFNAFVTELGVSGQTLVYSSFLGGSGVDKANALAVDAAGNAWVAGVTSSPNFPVLLATQPAKQLGTDAFLSLVAAGGASLRLSTFLGGSLDDAAFGLAIFGSSAYLGGTTASSDFPTTPGVIQAAYSGSTDGFVTKLNNEETTLTPTSGTGSTPSFTFTYFDGNGYQDIAGAQIVINSTLTAVNSCYILFARPETISLAGDVGTTFNSTGLGSPSVLQNSQCTVLAALSNQTGAANSVTLTLTVTFKPAFVGIKNVWTNFNTVAGASQGWSELGTYTATAPAQAITVVSVSPSSGAGQTQAFTFTYFDPYGAPDISGAQIVFNTTLSGVNDCYVLFSGANTISLASDDGNTFTTAILGQQTVLQNSHCIVYPGNSDQVSSGQSLTVTVLVAFKPALAGNINVYTSANNNAGLRTAFPQLGTWTVPVSGPPLSFSSLTPVSATGPSQALRFVYGDPTGYADVTSVQVIINPTPATSASCVIQIIRASGSITLATDSGLGVTTAALGQPAALQNSQCVVNAAASSQYGTGNFFTATLFVSMKTSGGQNIYTNLAGATATTALVQAGTWNVTSPATMSVLPVNPSTGTALVGVSQYFIFTFSDPAGVNDISGSQIVLFPSLQGSSSCYILWGQGNNVISLASDNALTFTTGVMGSVGILQNSQCSVDPSKSFQVQAGNTANLTIAVSFKALYRQFAQFYSFANVENVVAVWTPFLPASSRFTVQ